MRSTYTGMPRLAASGRSHPRVGLTDQAVIDAFVQRRIEDASLLAKQTEPSYADFFSAPLV